MNGDLKAIIIRLICGAKAVLLSLKTFVIDKLSSGT